MAFARCIIYSATKNIKKTRIDASSNLCAATGIEFLRVFSLQILDLANPQFPEIFRNAFAYTWDGLKFSECPRLGECIHGRILHRTKTNSALLACFVLRRFAESQTVEQFIPLIVNAEDERCRCRVEDAEVILLR